jgi:LysM repeat protein
MGLEKVSIQVFRSAEPKLIKALFNPEEYSINKDNNFAVQAIPGLSAPIVQFVNGNLRTLEMELFFDTWDTPAQQKKDVRDFTKQVVGLLDIDSELHAPPLLMVSWSSLQFRCVLARANQKFIMFESTGTPVRARVTCTFNEVIDPEQESKQVNRQTADFSKVRVVTRGDTLSSLAHEFYSDPRLWRPIAIANGLKNPRSIVAGQSLLIPTLPYVDPQSRESVS